MNVASISGFKPGSWVIMSLNDLELNFPVDGKGVLYWSDDRVGSDPALIKSNFPGNSEGKDITNKDERI